ncbi:MAG: hypothetical protein A3A88_00440 [Nitrospirae bacterium RIFCSPLOWO2_01_FULL_62_17]|nr:MAG: hypothetical protein A3A88_00440 [Nitrospirae bacterium RIFCSPLOWO2_01_FULL_62_17]
MSLSFGFTSPRDVFAKAQRDFEKLKEAIASQNQLQMGDALQEFAATVLSLKDWLGTGRCPSFNK